MLKAKLDEFDAIEGDRYSAMRRDRWWGPSQL